MISLLKQRFSVPKGLRMKHTANGLESNIVKFCRRITAAVD